MKQDENREGDKPQETFNLRKQTEGCWSGRGWEGWGGWMMDIGEGMCYGEHCELCKTDESQNCTLKQIIHYMLIKKIKQDETREGDKR